MHSYIVSYISPLIGNDSCKRHPPCHLILVDKQSSISFCLLLNFCAVIGSIIISGSDNISLTLFVTPDKNSFPRSLSFSVGLFNMSSNYFKSSRLIKAIV